MKWMRMGASAYLNNGKVVELEINPQGTIICIVSPDSRGYTFRVTNKDKAKHLELELAKILP
jgi:hypothetical protein